jgi:NAD(P)-dependent dehydrogenase (short-subunit alcohol dehydrogenase family)
VTRTWFITGTSTGLGRTLTEQLLQRGDRVAATLRTPSRLDDLAAQFGDRLWRRALDVTDTEQVRSVVDAAFRQLGHVDVVVSNAGTGVYGTAEELSDAQIDDVIATNLTGSIQLARAVVPHLRAQGGGRLLQVSSMGGLVAFPGFSIYHATKWGIEGFCDALAAEIEPFGIRTTLVEPGIFETPFYDTCARTPVMDHYADNPTIARGDIAPEDVGSDVDRIATAMIDVAEEPDPPRRLLLGPDAYTYVTAAWRERLGAADAQRERTLSTARDTWRAAVS